MVVDFFIKVNRCHLKGEHCGLLLSVVGMDSNNMIVPLAIYVYKIDNIEI